MAAVIDEQTQFQDAAGKPIVNGTIHIGTQGADPPANLISIFSDRDLQVSLANPQLTDANGRSVNKIWVPARYSIEVQDSNNVQQYIELDNGEGTEAGLTTLGNVSGADTITATAAATITAYVDLETYVFKTAQINTGNVTLNIDSIGAKSIKKNSDEQIGAGNFAADQVVIVVFNATDDIFEWTNQNIKILTSTQIWSKGADITSATTLVLGGDGNYFDVTGNTGPIGTITVPKGVLFMLQFDSTPTLTNSATLDIPGEADIIMTAGDRVIGFSQGANDVQILTVFRAKPNKEFYVPMAAFGNVFPYTDDVANYPVRVVNSTQAVQFTFFVPADFVSLTSAGVINIPDTTETVQFDVTTSFAAIGEAQDTNTDSIANGTFSATADQIASADVSAALTGLAAGDLVGLTIDSDTSDMRISGLRIVYAAKF